MSYNNYTALHRFGLGPLRKGGLVDLSGTPQKWLFNQLHQEESLKPLSGQFHSSDYLTKQIVRFTKLKGGRDRKNLKNELKKIYLYEMQARFIHSLNTHVPFTERLVHFWSNHFTVSIKEKPFMAGIVGSHEREAIRPHVLSNFSDMLLAVYQHPAMLAYLDNIASIGPNSKVGSRKKKGLNENLAREILELHTLGVGGGYTQKDVIGLAKIITGWTIKPPKLGGGGFQYIHLIHEPGKHRLLGKTYNQKGQAQGIAAIRDLARHPSTAKFVATKLARHFVSDDPSPKTIQTLVRVYNKTDGDLRAMAETLIKMKEIWNFPLTKVKTPYEMIVSSLRLLGVDGRGIEFDKVIASLALLNHTPFSAPSPAGWSDNAEDWISPNATLNRVEWCHALANLIKPNVSPVDLARQNFGRIANPETLLWIERAPSGAEGLALLLASPEWQRR